MTAAENQAWSDGARNNSAFRALLLSVGRQVELLEDICLIFCHWLYPPRRRRWYKL